MIEFYFVVLCFKKNTIKTGMIKYFVSFRDTKFTSFTIIFVE